MAVWNRWRPGRRGVEAERARLVAGAPAGALRELLAEPMPGMDTPVAELRLLAIDLETTGLDPRRDSIVSIGLVPVDGASIELGGAGHVVVRTDSDVGQSPVFHGITDDDVAAGLPLAGALDEVLRALTGRVLLAHHAGIEAGFLGAACRSVHGAPLPLRVVDTMALQRRLLWSGWQEDPPDGSLRLWAARERFGLPRYRAHHALADAMACAELYLAQVAELEQRGPLTLGDLASP